MGKRPSVDLQAISVEVQSAPPRENSRENLETLALLYLQALDELGYRRKAPRKTMRVRNAPRRKSVRGVTYGTGKT